MGQEIRAEGRVKSLPSVEVVWNFFWNNPIYIISLPLIENRRVLEKRTFVSDIGSSETFHCSLQNETSMIKWYVKGTVASPTGRRVKASGGKLTVSNVRLSDGGTYECGGLKYTRFYIIYVNGG